MRLPQRTRRRFRIEIIPLIDIMFFLLATFMMVSLSMVKNEGVRVRLPRAETASRQAERNAQVISITDRGGIYFNKDSVTLPQLITRLKQLKARDAQPRVFINGDERASLGAMIRILDEVRKQGIAEVAFQTQPVSNRDNPAIAS